MCFAGIQPVSAQLLYSQLASDKQVVAPNRSQIATTSPAFEAKLTARLDDHETAIVDVLRRIMELLDPSPAPLVPEKSMGFHTTIKIPGKPTRSARGQAVESHFPR